MYPQQQVVSSTTSATSSNILATTSSPSTANEHSLMHHSLTNSFITPQNRTGTGNVVATGAAGTVGGGGGAGSTNNHLHPNITYSSNKTMVTTISTQTDLTMSKLTNQDEIFASELEQREAKIEDLTRSIEELHRQLKVYKEESDSQKTRLNKCIEFSKQLLVEKSIMEKKAARQKCMQNRLRLGQFVTQRQGKLID